MFVSLAAAFDPRPSTLVTKKFTPARGAVNLHAYTGPRIA
jgi:hypothetical protein